MGADPRARAAEPYSWGFLGWTFVVCAIKSVTLIAYVWLAHLLTRARAADPQPVSTLELIFTAWMLLEASAFPYWLHAHRRLSRRHRATHACQSQVNATNGVACVGLRALACVRWLAWPVMSLIMSLIMI